MVDLVSSDSTARNTNLACPRDLEMQPVSKPFYCRGLAQPRCCRKFGSSCQVRISPSCASCSLQMWHLTLSAGVQPWCCMVAMTASDSNHRQVMTFRYRNGLEASDEPEDRVEPRSSSLDESSMLRLVAYKTCVRRTDRGCFLCFLGEGRSDCWVKITHPAFPRYMCPHGLPLRNCRRAACDPEKHCSSYHS